MQDVMCHSAGLATLSLYEILFILHVCLGWSIEVLKELQTLANVLNATL